MIKAVAVGVAHIIHADRRDGLEARVDFRRADGEAAAAANADDAHVVPVYKIAGAKVVGGGAEGFGIGVGIDAVARRPFAFTPVGQVDS